MELAKACVKQKATQKSLVNVAGGSILRRLANVIVDLLKVV